MPAFFAAFFFVALRGVFFAERFAAFLDAFFFAAFFFAFLAIVEFSLRAVGACEMNLPARSPPCKSGAEDAGPG